ncbi:MAG: rRNA maturation RNase YbeY [Candidatus Sedimenticola sp. 6PFRAG1]
MNLELDVQRAVDSTDMPDDGHLRRWVETTLAGRRDSAELTIRMVAEKESHELNLQYRDKDRPTNVLSFPSDLPEMVESDLLGDLVICVPVVVHEAAEQGKSPEAHWAHMVVHGTLHLLGFDHQNEQEAEEMEGLEREIIEILGYPDPYKACDAV